MSDIHLRANTTEDLPCTNCGSPGNVVREANTPEAKKMKCRSCGFMYTARDSMTAKEAGAIPDAAPQLDHAQGADIRPEVDSRDVGGIKADASPLVRAQKIVRTPSYVLISKDRIQSEFANGKSVKQVILRWEYENRKFDLFELTPKQAKTKVELQ